MALAQTPLVNVVTPVYNGARYLASCIESVLGQTYQNWEYIIVDNCSTDNSLEIAQNYARNDPRIRVLSNQEHLGAVANWNYSVSRMSPESKFCKVLHADDWLFPECLQRMVEAAEANPSAAIVSSYVLLEKNFTDRPTPERSVLNAEFPYCIQMQPGRELGRAYLLGNVYLTFAPSTMLIRCDSIRRRDMLYDDSTGIYAALDRQVALELLENGDYAFVHQVLVGAREHVASLTSKINQHSLRYPETLRLLRRFGHIYLSDAEYDLRWKHAISVYSSFLGRSVFARRKKGFWRFHREQLREFGSPIGFLALPTHAAREVWRVLTGPLTLRPALDPRAAGPPPDRPHQSSPPAPSR